MVVRHNLTAMNAQRMLGITAASIAKNTEKLSSGFRVNRASDDAAGLSISEKMRKQIRGLTQASLNVQDGVSMVQTADGALSEVSDMLQRMNELAIKASNGTVSSDDRKYIQDEINQIKSEIDRIGSTTKFNETHLFSNSDFKPNLYIHSDVLKTACNTALTTALSTLELYETPTLTENEDGTYNLAIGKSGEVGRTIKDGGTVKMISNVTRRIELARDDMKCLYDASGKLVYENIQYKYYGSSAPVKDEDKHLSSDENMEFILKLSEENSIEDIVNSNKYYVYTPVAEALITTADVSYGSKVGGHTVWAKDGTDSEGHSYFKIRKTETAFYQTESGEDLTFTHLGDNHWVTNGTLYDSSGFKWEAGTEFINTLMHDNRNYVYYNGGADLLSIMGQYGYNYDSKHLLYTDATLTYVTADAFKYVDIPNMITASDAKDLIDSKIYSAMSGASFTDAAGNELDYRVLSKADGNYNIAFFAKGKNPEDNANVKSVAIQAGAESDKASKIEIEFARMNSETLGIDSADVTSQDNAVKTIDSVSTAIQSVSKIRSKYGAYQNRMEHTIRNLNNVMENTTAAESAIRDANMAKEMVEFAKQQMLMQVGQTILAQANKSNQSVLALLQ